MTAARFSTMIVNFLIYRSMRSELQTAFGYPKYLYLFDFAWHLVHLITWMVFSHSLFPVESANTSLQ